MLFRSELDRWRQRDPIKVYRARALESGVNAEVLDVIERDAKRKVDEATERCKAAPPPPPEILLTDVYADGGSAWRN